MPCLHSVLSSAKELVIHFKPKFLPALSQHVYFFYSDFEQISDIFYPYWMFFASKMLPHKIKKITKNRNWAGLKVSKHFSSYRKKQNSLVLRLGRLIWTQDAVSLLKQLAARLLLIKSPCLWIEVIAHIPSSLSWRSKMDGGWPKMKVNLSPCTSQSVYKAWKRSDRTLHREKRSYGDQNDSHGMCLVEISPLVYY